MRNGYRTHIREGACVSKPSALRVALVAALCLMLSVFATIGLTPSKALADEEVTADVSLPVSLICDSITPLDRISHTGEDELLELYAGDDLSLEAVYEGGEGELSYAWAISRDGGITFEDLPSTTNVHDIINAQKNGDGEEYIYRLYTYDDSIQRQETLFHVLVKDKPAPPDPPGPDPQPDPKPDPKPNPIPVDNPTGGSNGSINPKTGDLVSWGVTFGLGVLAVAAFIMLISYRRFEEE